jgi:8-oxo-dGTP diphosphatase
MIRIDVVGAAIYDSYIDKYLVTMRDNKRSQGGLWEFPGGKIEKGESNEEALKREILEELKISIDVHKLLKDYTYEYPDVTVRLVTYLCTIREGKPELTEHENMRWVTKEEMKVLEFASADIPTVELLSK